MFSLLPPWDFCLFVLSKVAVASYFSYSTTNDSKSSSRSKFFEFSIDYFEANFQLLANRPISNMRTN